ncbi:U6 small nuclear RNA (adenine-(43)-N(6))-methyltransferase isoform X2 [Olea europaea var. sylvestris]|uniref:U6 small nuclear RNA (adenine-(43)-N(6))-methyltransferase isoform X2 n=1 Tax=Olea europaea var. sylvestris TaxID=158386 RepID=UPI000C1D400E|nr:U6 small nuclear RNA (adenine-(43)-N(6))-methyltransferase isoform X2 [Olea europaea var. sylvestris]
MPSKKRRKRGGERRVIHPRNKYSENPPDFGLLASLYPSFEPYVFYSLDGRPRIDWTDFNATRELTRVLLLHDHGLNWWIPDGQLCPTVPNRSNYIHWIEDLLASDLIPCTRGNSVVKGFDIGTGANCIYPLLGASLLGWTFVGSDVTDVAIEWANRNVKSNPHLSELIEIRRVDTETKIFDAEELQNKQKDNINSYVDSTNTVSVDMGPSPSFSLRSQSVKNSYHGPPVLVGVVKDGESFDFCMCNPPFFMTMEEAGLNPKTSCGGTPEEMVCLGGEEAFITRIIEDSAQLKRAFRWYTSMVGRKSNLNILTSKLWNVGVTVVKTTEFVQGQTSRWGLAWSFMPPSRKMLFSHVTEKKNLSFMLEITASQNHCNTILKSETQNENEAVQCKNELEISRTSNDNNCQSDDLQFRISVFQQIPGTLLVRSTLHQKESSSSGLFSLIFKQLEKVLKNKFCTERVSADGSCSNLRR